MLNSPPLIGITTYARDKNKEFRIDTDYVDAVRRAGGIPLLIAPGERYLSYLADTLDALILSGGGDVDPTLYGADVHDQVAKVDTERDELELSLAKMMIDGDKPMLCVCRGMQVLNVALGGTLIQHIPDVFDNSLDHRLVDDTTIYGSGPINHEVEVDADSRLAQMMQSSKVMTTSWHHQALDEVAQGLKVVAKAADGVIEAAELPGKPVFAVQWHPEMSAAEDKTQQNLFNEIVRLAHK